MTAKSQIRQKYQATVGIETHVQLRTKTKLFSAVGNDARSAEPNTLISHIDVGVPGALPVLNKAAIELAVRAAFVLNTEPRKFSKFDRKHYFYPDLPKGYQITQYEDPIISGGYVDFKTGGDNHRVKIARVHLEEDAGKNTHPAGADYSLVDLNRAGTPLLEIVSEPEIHSPAEAKAYARELYLLMKYARVSDVDLYHGNMRFDVNISVNSEPGKSAKRVEIKNLNSFRSVENAVAYEIKRQSEIYEKGGTVTQETRGWDEVKQKTTGQRSKEEAHDYRYMPEPDIPPIVLDDEFIARVKAGLPALPPRIRGILNKLSISPQVIEDILDLPPPVVEQIIKAADGAGSEHGRRLAFWALESGELDPPRDIELSQMISRGEINQTAAKTIRQSMAAGRDSPRQIAKRLNLIQVSDETAIEKIVAEVLDQNSQAAQDVKNGETKAIGFLVGQVMAKSKGQANPQIAQDIIRKQLGL